MIARRSLLEILVLSPRLKFGGPKRTSWTGQEDGWGKKQKNHFYGVNFAVRKRPFFDFFENLQDWRFSSGNFSVKTAPTEKMEYTTTKPTKNARKLSSQIFDFRTFVSLYFHPICFDNYKANIHIQ